MATRRETLIQILKDQLPQVTDPKGTDHMIEDLGADDFDLNVIRENLEEQLDIHIDDDAWAQCGTVDDTVEIIERLPERF